MKKLMMILLLFFFSLNAEAILIEEGDMVIIDYDLTGQTPAAPYDGIYSTLFFNSADYLNDGESLRLELFEEETLLTTREFTASLPNISSLGIDLVTANDGTGSLRLTSLLGSFELDHAAFKGRIFSDDGLLSTPPVNGTIRAIPEPGISLLLALGLLGFGLQSRYRN